MSAAAGYPYFLQQFGQETWNETPVPPITLGDARVGVVYGQSALDQGFFRARWDRATKGEQRYFRAMADDGDRGSRAATWPSGLAERLLAWARFVRASFPKGLVYAPEHGVVAFTVPGMAGFIDRQPTE